MTSKQKKVLTRILIAGALFLVLMLAEHVFASELIHKLGWIMLPIYAVPYLIVGYDILLKAVRNIRNGQVFDENFLMIVATFGAFGVKEFSEAVAVMLFYQVGELFQSYAVGKSRESIAGLMEICPDYANVEEDGKLVEMDPDDVEVGSIIVIKPGEKVPLDGVVVEGSSMLDTSALTGESVPRRAVVGQEVISGCINGDSTLKVRTSKEFEDSTVARILELVEDAGSRKARVENFITKFARVYTPFVTIAALLLAVIPPIVLHGGFADWLQRACVFLVISCPCALVISVPLGFFGGIGVSSRKGILVKGGNFMEAIASLHTMVFDKTGTLTKGEFSVAAISPVEMSEQKLLELAAIGEGYSNHPIAESIRKAYGQEADLSRASEAQEIPGQGVSVKVDGQELLIGNHRLMEENEIDYTPVAGIGTAVYLAVNGRFAGSILIADSIKEGVKEALAAMKAAGVKRLVMLTGDRKETAEAVARELGIDEVRAELLPQDKVTAVEALLKDKQEQEYLGFVGDGVNDAPVLMRADVGFAMGSMGSDAAIEAADVVIMDDDIAKIPEEVRISRKTMAIVKANIVFALGVKFLVLILGALGMANMWAAVFADVGVAVLAILNSMRTLKM